MVVSVATFSRVLGQRRFFVGRGDDKNNYDGIGAHIILDLHVRFLAPVALKPTRRDSY